MLNCTTPAANMNAQIISSNQMLIGSPIYLKFTTDENGYFKVNYNGKHPFTTFEISTYHTESRLIVNNSLDMVKQLGNIYVGSIPSNFLIRLNVINAYSANDTLIIRDYSSSDPNALKFIPGPFSSGIIDSIVGFPFKEFPFRASDIVNFGGPSANVKYMIRSWPENSGYWKTAKFYIGPLCSQDFSEVVLTLE